MEREVELREGNISLVLDSYDDLFSDFDPRDYSQKALSDDFLVLFSFIEDFLFKKKRF